MTPSTSPKLDYDEIAEQQQVVQEVLDTHTFPTRIGVIRGLLYQCAVPQIAQVFSSTNFANAADTRIGATMQAFKDLGTQKPGDADWNATIERVNRLHESHNIVSNTEGHSVQPEYADAFRYIVASLVTHPMQVASSFGRKTTEQQRESYWGFFQAIGHELGLQETASFDETQQWAAAYEQDVILGANANEHLSEQQALAGQLLSKVGKGIPRPFKTALRKTVLASSDRRVLRKLNQGNAWITRLALLPFKRSATS